MLQWRNPNSTRSHALVVALLDKNATGRIPGEYLVDTRLGPPRQLLILFSSVLAVSPMIVFASTLLDLTVVVSMEVQS